MADTEWNPKTIKKINQLRQKILMRKIMMDYIIKIYEGWDRFYRRALIASAALTFVSAVLSELLGDDAQPAKVVGIITSIITGGLIELKDYVGFGKLRDKAKGQTIKYKALFDRIDNEFTKPIKNRQREDEFLYWVNREYESIQNEDPELGYTDRKQFDKYCVDLGIKLIENDISELKRLQNKNYVADSTSNGISIVPDTKMRDDQKENNADPMRLIKERADADKCERDSFKEAIKNVNHRADINWTIDRLNNLNGQQ